MTDVQTLGRAAFRDYATDGVPSSGTHQPVKADIRALFDAIEAQKATTVDTLAAAKALTTRPDAILIKGKTAAFDGWGGVFVWMPGSSTTPDDALVFACTAGTAGRYKRLYSGSIHSKWFCAADGVTDDLAGLNAVLALAGAGNPVVIDDGRHKFTAALTVVAGSEINITGEGRGSVLLYAGVSTTATLLTFGDGADYDRMDLRGFTIESSTVMTSGTALRVRKYQHIDCEVWCGDEFSQGWKLYDACWFDSCTVVNLFSSHFYGSHKGLVWTGGFELNADTCFIKGNAGAGTGVHIGGGTGGFNACKMNVLTCDIGVLVDTSITSTANSQIFLDGCKIDSCTTAAVRLNDALGASLLFRSHGGWLASSTAGVGLDIVNWASGIIDIDGGSFYNHSADGIKIADATPTILISRDSRITANGGYGINATTAVAIFCDARLVNNNGGGTGLNYHANVTPTDQNGFSSRTLAFYEQGTWTPTLIGGSTAGSTTLTTAKGYFTRKGNEVTASFRVVINALDGAATGELRITGLPYAALTDADMSWGGGVASANIVTHAAFSQFGLRVDSAAQYIRLTEFGVPSSSGGASIVNITALANSASLIGTITYRIAA